MRWAAVSSARSVGLARADRLVEWDTGRPTGPSARTWDVKWAIDIIRHWTGVGVMEIWVAGASQNS